MTIRERDSMAQKRVALDQVESYLRPAHSTTETVSGPGDRGHVRPVTAGDPAQGRRPSCFPGPPLPSSPSPSAPASLR
ncbi:hypothetical protein GCM10017559_44820 [Streptosporangium longisporum]|uniref:Uncharacterized protein n=1 Tax=Streptosporangium longisporum TaxID=46187 RepID=A0ABP6KNQ2_9ACTN